MGSVKEKKGDYHEYSSVEVNTMNMVNQTSCITDLWSLDVLGIKHPEEEFAAREKEVFILKNFEESVTRDKSGRYEVSMPWIEGHPPLLNNFEIAKTRLDRLMKKLENDGYYSEYDQVFNEWLSEGIIEVIPPDEINNEGYYLPHRHVVKLSSTTTKLRPVFDASAKFKNQPSLNQCIEKGINLLSLIPSILIGFRISRIGVTSDIKKAFLQISLQERERNFLRFVWYSREGELIFFRHARVVFGVNCSPFLLAATINHHLQSIEQEGRYSAPIVTKLKESFYVDNCVTSVDSVEDLKNFIHESKSIMKEAQFELRCWENTLLEESCSEQKMTSVLGLRWNVTLDTLSINFDNLKNIDTNVVTKKIILSIANRIFDPIGFSSPVVLRCKLILQRTWLMKLNWNSQVPEEIKNEFIQWLNELYMLSTIKISRWIGIIPNSLKNLSIHVFCDASQDAYARSIFSRVEDINDISVQLIQSKSRVSPVKKLSIPRLELLAATIGARLFATVRDSIEKNNINNFDTYMWTDSTVVLAWIKRKEIWKPFIWNRVTEIKKIINENFWYHVPGSSNPADLPSRGCTTTRLINSLWWEGPKWLYKDKSAWPSQDYQVEEEQVSEERKKVTSTLLSNKYSDFSWLYKYFSKYSKLIRLIGWLYRFIYNSTHQDKRRSELTTEELDHAEKVLIRCVQEEAFSEKLENMKNLVPFKDECNIIRIKTKISERKDFEDFLFPILLPARHPVVERLILDIHLKNHHVGIQGTLSISREKFWITGGRKTIKRVLKKCMTCRRHEVRSFASDPVALPLHRVQDTAVFGVIGIDLFGPLYIRDNTKVWITLFTCAVYRAVHMELVTSLSSDCFLQAFRRFIARRGRPAIVYSDNATNFVGAENSLNSLEWDTLQTYFAMERIKWKFNPPSSPWWGGWWERLIRLIKQLLRKTLGKTSLTYEILSSIVCEVESIVNSRPLTYISEDNTDLTVLTPALFLREINTAAVMDLDQVENNSLTRRLRYRCRLREELKKRFRKEYLGLLLLKRCKEKIRYPQLGEVVLIGDDQEKRAEWTLGKVIKLYPGKDEKVRMVELKTAKGKALRSIQCLYPLEAEDEHKIDLNQKLESDRLNVKESRTRSGRLVKPNPKYQ